jgi:sugar phosphate permease
MNMTYLAILYVITGVFQSGGWPSNVAVMGVWFGKGTRGLVMGIWNAHTSIGNILGSLIATAMFTKAHYEYHQLSLAVPHGNSTTIETSAKLGLMTKEAAGLHCDANKKCVAFTTDQFGGAAANATEEYFFYFLNSTSKAASSPTNSTPPHHNGSHWLSASASAAAASATCDIGSWCTFQKDVPYDLSYYVLGAIIAVGGVVILLFLVPHPRDVGLPSPDEEDRKTRANADPESSLNESLLGSSGDEIGASISPMQALCIPGVIEFALCFFFAKFVSYTFLFWLPYYLENIGLSKSRSGDLSTIFDVGGIVGGILCGLISDKLGKRAVVAAVSMAFAIPAMAVYRSVVTGPLISDGVNGGLMFVAGTFINGVYALITTAVSADLGTSPSLKGNSNALAMVTAIIDGTGSLGACITGVAITRMSSAFDTCNDKQCDVPGSDPGGWNGVFLVLEICAGMTVLMLARLIFKECKELCCAPSGPSTNLQYGGR